MKVWGNVFIAFIVFFSALKSIAAEEYTDADLNKALKLAAQTLMQRRPSLAERAELKNGLKGYQFVISKYMESDRFKQAIHRYHQNFFSMEKTSNGINFNEPANLATYLIINDIDFRELVTATYCVNDNMEKVLCSTFMNDAEAKAQGAGVITTQGFLNKWVGSYNFKRVAKVFENFSCHAYPDNEDQGLTAEQISEKMKTFRCTDCTPKCYSCHRSINPRAVLFYNFDRKGKFVADRNSRVTTHRDTGAPSTIHDLVMPGVQPTYYGKPVNSVREFGIGISKSKKFRNCVAQRFANFMFGRDFHDKIPTDLHYLYGKVGEHGFKIKKVLYEIMLSERFIKLKQ